MNGIAVDGIAVDIIMLFLKGIPEGLLVILALHFFTRTKIQPKKYFLICFIYVGATYLIRLLPITLGVNTVLSLFIMILAFQFIYNGQLSKVIRSIASAAVILILVAVSEVLNMLLLTILYGQTKAEALFNASNALIKSLYTIPSTVFFAILIITGYFILKKLDMRKNTNGKDGKTTGV